MTSVAGLAKGASGETGNRGGRLRRGAAAWSGGPAGPAQPQRVPCAVEGRTDPSASLHWCGLGGRSGGRAGVLRRRRTRQTRYSVTSTQDCAGELTEVCGAAAVPLLLLLLQRPLGPLRVEPRALERSPLGVWAAGEGEPRVGEPLEELGLQHRQADDAAGGLGVDGDVEALLPEASAQVCGGQLRGVGRAGRGQVVTTAHVATCSACSVGAVGSGAGPVGCAATSVHCPCV
jgi:hypothetical protein